MKTLYDVPWDDGSGEPFEPSKQQVKLGMMFLKLWNIPIDWITHAYAHHPANLSNKLFTTTDRNWVKLCGVHPNVPKEVNGFYLKNSEENSAYGHWYWDNGGST